MIIVGYSRAAAAAPSGFTVAATDTTPQDGTLSTVTTTDDRATFSGINIGAAPGGGETRSVALAVFGAAGSPGNTLTATLNGQSCTVYKFTGNNEIAAMIWCPSIASGTTADLVLTWTGTGWIDLGPEYLAAVRVIDGQVRDNAGTYQATIGTPSTVTIDVASGGAVACLGYARTFDNTANITLSNATTIVDDQFDARDWRGGDAGLDTGLSADAARSIGWQTSVSGRGAFAALSIEEAP